MDLNLLRGLVSLFPMNEAKLKSREACVYFWAYIFPSFSARKLSLSCAAVKPYQELSVWLHSSLSRGGIGCPDAVCVASGAGGESRGGMPSDRSLFNPPDTLTVPCGARQTDPTFLFAHRGKRASATLSSYSGGQRGERSLSHLQCS